MLQEESRVVIIRFGHDWDQVCMQQDEVLPPMPPLSFYSPKESFCRICFS